MAIPFADQSKTPAGDIVRRPLNTTNRAAFAASIKAALLHAGWTTDPEGETLPNATLTFTGVPGNNETCAIGTVTYTWKTTLTGAANEVRRGANAAGCASNLWDAITDNSPNEGVTYGTGTAVNPHVTATMPTTTTVTVRGRSVEDAGLPLSENSGATSWNRSYLGDACAGKLWSGRTPQGLQFKLEIWDSGQSNYLDLVPASYDGKIRLTFESAGNRPFIQPSIAQPAEIIASKYHLVIFYPSFSFGVGNCYMGLVYLPGASAPSEIEGATKAALADVVDASNTAPIEITAPGHGLKTGAEVRIAEVKGNTAANGTFIITKTGNDTFTLNGTEGNGEYTGGGVWTRTDAVELTIKTHDLNNGDKVYIDRGSLNMECYQLNGSWIINVIDANTIRLRGSHGVIGKLYDDLNPSLLAGPAQCSQAIWAGWDKRGGDDSGFPSEVGSWRNKLPVHNNPAGFKTIGEFLVLFNGRWWYDNRDGDLQLYANTPGRRWWGGRFWLKEAVVAWSTRGFNGSDPPEAVGLLFNAAVAQCSIPMDSILTDTDGNKWLAFSFDRSNYGAQLLWHVPDGYN